MSKNGALSKVNMTIDGVFNSLKNGPSSQKPAMHILNMIQDTVDKKKGAVFASWYDIKGKKTDERTFSRIWEKSGEVAYYLHHVLKIEKGQRVILCYYFGLHFFEVFFGCLRAGVVAVLVYPPGPPLKKSLTKLSHVVDDCEPALILTDSMVNGYRLMDAANPLSKTRKLWPSHIKFYVTERLRSGLVHEEKTLGTDIAFLQYTSGSTGDPKGVMITFEALAANVTLIHDSYARDLPMDHKEVVGFSWLPQYHDMGLIFLGIAPLFSGWRMHMISPVSFIKNPLLWMELMSRHRVNTSIAPDFSYNYVVRKYREAKASGQSLPTLDLSSIVYLLSGAEPCRQETEKAFLDEFSSFGLRSDFYGVAFGLAETCVGCCYAVGAGCQLSTPRLIDNGRTYVACGQLSLLHSTVRLLIVDADKGIEVKGDETGEVWLAGPSIAAGYHNKPELTESTFNAQLSSNTGAKFLRTGDLAFIQGDYLYVCGRIKDLVITNGVNYYPQDIEYVVQTSTSAIRQGCVAAFSTSEGDLEIVFEVRDDTLDAASVCAKVWQVVFQEVGVAPGKAVAIAARTIPKTTSGKIRRRATREALHSKQLRVLASCGRTRATEPRSLAESDEENPPSSTNDSNTLEAILFAMLGNSFDDNVAWDELGLTSLMAVELQNQIAQKLKVPLSPMFQEEYPTPKALATFIENAKENAFPVKLKNLKTYQNNLSWEAQSALQLAGIVAIVLVVAFSFVPAYHVGKLLASAEAMNITIGRVKWQWVPLVVPSWMFSLSLFTLFCKWVVVGKYKAQVVCVPSTMFVRWWFVDRLVHLWEIWVGSFLLDTPLIWLFYVLMGAKIQPTSTVNAFIREFDLVRIGGQSAVTYPLGCRRFSGGRGNEEFHLRFRPINIGSQCHVKGHVGLGSTMENGSYVTKLSVIPEGSQIPTYCIAEGNPAQASGKEQEKESRTLRFAVKELIKLLWIVVELYFFFGALLLGQWALNERLPSGFRYTPLLYWVLLVMFTTFMSCAVCVLLKWVVIGKKHPSPVASTIGSEMADWIVDYHFRVSLTIFEAVAKYSKVGNLYLMALGMDVDLESKIQSVKSCTPSKVDMLYARRSFFPGTNFDPQQGGTLKEIRVTDSSFGHSVTVTGGSEVVSCQVPPQTKVAGFLKGDVSSGLEFTMSFRVAALWILYWAAVVVSAIPAYELFQYDCGGSSGLGFSVAKMALVFVVQTTVWLLLFAILQSSMLIQDKRGNWGTRIADSYHIYMSYLFFVVFRWSFLHISFGTPFVNWYLQLLNATVEGKLLYFGRSYDFPLLTFADKTVVDNALVMGHQVSAGMFGFGPTTCAGTLHEGTYIVSNTDMRGKVETGPLVFVAPDEHVKMQGVSEKETAVPAGYRYDFDLEAADKWSDSSTVAYG